MQESIMGIMHMALDQARQAGDRGEVPVGAIIADAQGRIIAAAGNQVEALCDASAHAEMLVMRAACLARGQKFLEDCDLYVTLEPCPMCAGAIALHRLRRVIFAAYDPKSGGVEHGPRIFDQPTCHHRPEIIGGVEEQAAASLLTGFFQRLRS